MQADTDIQKFVIISIPRTGSNLFVGALDSHPEIICHYELFHKDAIYTSGKYGKEWINNYSVKMRNNNPVAFLDFVNRHTFNKTVKTIGYKIFAGHNDELLEDLISDKKVKKIILKRDNIFMAYLSQLEAQKTGVYVVAKGAEDKKAKYDFKVSIDFNKFKYFEKTHKDFFENVEKKLIKSSQKFLSLEYQTILDQENRIRMLNFLKVKPDPDLLKIHFEKQNKRKLGDRISNYMEIKKLFAKHEYNEYLQDV